MSAPIVTPIELKAELDAGKSLFLPEFLENLNGYDLGERQDGVCLHESRLMYVRMQVCNRLYKILFVRI